MKKTRSLISKVIPKKIGIILCLFLILFPLLFFGCPERVEGNYVKKDA